EGVADGGTHELETAARQVFAHRVGFGRACRNFLVRPPGVALGRATHKTPDVIVERAGFFLDVEKRLRILNGSRNLQAISNDAWVCQQLLYSLAGIAGDL